MREAQAAAALNHPNIATVYAIDEHEGQMFIAMEFIEGESLKEILAAGPMKLKKVIDYSSQISEGLKAAHEKGVVHRDIKSANIMVTNTGQITIMDFGLAKLSGGSMLTKQGMTMGNRRSKLRYQRKFAKSPRVMAISTFHPTASAS